MFKSKLDRMSRPPRGSHSLPDFYDDGEESVHSEASSIITEEDNIYLTSASVSSARTSDESAHRSSSSISRESRQKISLGPAINCDRMMSSHTIQSDKESRRSIFGDQFESNSSNSMAMMESPLTDFTTELTDAEEEQVLESRNTSPARNAILKQKVRVTLNDFDFDHLKIQDEMHDDEDSCEEGENWIVKKLEKNSPELYWLQLTTEIEDPARLIEAMRDNTAVRNITVYPCALEGLTCEETHNLVDSICKLPKLRTLIVFRDCGSLFLDPLLRYRPALTRLTLYKLDLTGNNILHKLIMLIAGFPLLEELSLEKYYAKDTAKVFKALSGVLPSMASLKTLSLTPARNVPVPSEGLLALIRALEKSNTIKVLALHGSEAAMDVKCVEALASILQVNTALEDVRLTGFWKSEDDFWKRFPGDLVDQVDFFLNLNKSGVRKLQLDVNANLATLKNAMMTHREQLDVIFILLQNNPVLAEAMA